MIFYHDEYNESYGPIIIAAIPPSHTSTASVAETVSLNDDMLINQTQKISIITEIMSHKILEFDIIYYIVIYALI